MVSVNCFRIKKTFRGGKKPVHKLTNLKSFRKGDERLRFLDTNHTFSRLCCIAHSVRAEITAVFD